MRIAVSIIACLLTTCIAHAELQNVQCGSDMRIRANYRMHHQPMRLTIPTLYDSLLSAATANEIEEFPSSTFGGKSIEIGMDEQHAIDLLSTEFSVLGTEPERALPTTRGYEVIGDDEVGLGSSRGFIMVESGKVVRVATRLGQFEESDSGSIVTTLVNALEEAQGEAGEAPRVIPNSGMRDDRKNGNTELKFEFDRVTIAVVYFDSPGASQNVTVTRIVGSRRWRAYPQPGDFQDE